MCAHQGLVQVDGRKVPAKLIIEALSAEYRLFDLQSLFSASYAAYHNACSMEDALATGIIARDVKDYKANGELPEYFVGMYYHIACRHEK